jgi:EAL domain-containing protein (putative c-di-GMP-specific phosphodiesterase class I)
MPSNGKAQGENRMNFVYTINFSRFSLCDPNLAETIISIVENYGIDFSCIAIEILEDKDLNDTEKDNLIKNISTLKDKGVLILLDDFGKGHTSFGDLTDFDINIIKIDKSITQNSVTETGFKILKNIIQTAKDIGFKTLCEGIETVEQENAAIAAGCDLLQGFYYYKPMSVATLENLFDNV